MGLTRKQISTVAVLLIGTFVVVLNQTLLSPALASIMRDLSIDAPTVQWVMSIYSLVEAVVIPLSAFLIGRFSTRQLFITGLIIFTAGSLLCAFSPGFIFLLLGRVCQAIAAGVFMPMIFTVLLLIFPREKRGSAMGLVSLVIGFAPAVGPTLSGVLVDSIGWRMLFVVITVVGVLLVLSAVKFLENYGDFERTSFDKLSVLLSTVGLVCLLYGLSTFSSTTNPAMTAGFIVVGLVVIAIFVRRQLKLENPLLKVTVLKTRNYRIAIIVAIINFGVLIGLGTILPLYLQTLRGFSALETGLTLLPGALIGAFVGYFAGRLFDRWGVAQVRGARRYHLLRGYARLPALRYEHRSAGHLCHLHSGCAGHPVPHHADEHMGHQFARQQRHPACQCSNEHPEPGLGCVHDGAHRVHLGARFDHRTEC